MRGVAIEEHLHPALARRIQTASPSAALRLYVCVLQVAQVVPPIEAKLRAALLSSGLPPGSPGGLAICAVLTRLHLARRQMLRVVPRTLADPSSFEAILALLADARALLVTARQALADARATAAPGKLAGTPVGARFVS